MKFPPPLITEYSPVGTPSMKPNPVRFQMPPVPAIVTGVPSGTWTSMDPTGRAATFVSKADANVPVDRKAWSKNWE
jgi:hypothetical protein